MYNYAIACAKHAFGSNSTTIFSCLYKDSKQHAFWIKFYNDLYKDSKHRACYPVKICEIKPTSAQIDDLKVFPFFNQPLHFERVSSSFECRRCINRGPKTTTVASA